MNEPNAKRVLAVSAHPDDVEFTCGGSLARWHADGWMGCLIVCTDGGKGSHDAAMHPATLIPRRRQEQQAAAAVLDFAEIEFLDHPDGELNRVPELVVEITRHIRRFRPQRIVGWDPWHRYELHPDHRAAGQSTLDAILAAGNPHYFPELLAAGLTPHQVAEVYLFGAEEADVWVDITNTVETKLAAIAQHCSQTEEKPYLLEDVRRCNADYGRQHGLQYAEVFKVLHPFCDT